MLSWGDDLEAKVLPHKHGNNLGNQPKDRRIENWLDRVVHHSPCVPPPNSLCRDMIKLIFESRKPASAAVRSVSLLSGCSEVNSAIKVLPTITLEAMRQNAF